MLKDEYKKIRLINQSLVVGEKSGKAKVFDNEEFKRKMRKRIGENALTLIKAAG